MAKASDPTATSAKSEHSQVSKPISAKTTQASTVQAVTEVIEAQKSRRKKSSNAADASAEQAINAASKLNDQPKPFATSASVSPMRLAKPVAPSSSFNAVVDAAYVAKTMALGESQMTQDEKAACVTFLFGISDAATHAMHASKDSAMRAAALAYKFWMLNQNDFGQSIIGKRIEAENKAIDQHNAAVEADKKLLKDYRAGKITFPAKPSSPQEAAEIAKKQQKLIELDNRTDNDWAALRRVKIEAKPTANPFTLVVKLVFFFVRPNDASLVSRYATALSVLNAHFKGVVTTTDQQMVDYLLTLGGFEAAISQAKLGNGKPANVALITPEKRKELQEKLVGDAKVRAATQPEETMIYPLSGHPNEGFAVMLHYYDRTGAKMVANLPLNADEVMEQVGLLHLQKAGARKPCITFMRRVLQLGNVVGGVVEKGEVAKKGLEKELHGAEKGDVNMDKSVSRRLTLRRDTAGAAQFVVSAKFAAASAIIHATPRDEGFVGMQHVNGLSAMAQEGFAALHEVLDDPMVSYFADIQPGTRQGHTSPLVWDIGNPEINLNRDLFWSQIGEGSEKALDIEPDFPGRVKLRVEIDEYSVKKLYREGAAIWGTSKRPNKKVTEMQLVFDKTGTVTLKIEAQADVEVATSGNTSFSETVKFRPEDLSRLLKALSEQAANNFVFEVDPSGAMAVLWKDTVGHYAAYQPLMTADKRMSDKRIGQMELTGPSIVERLEGVKGGTKKSARTKAAPKQG
jgi:hypothetical protein